MYLYIIYTYFSIFYGAGEAAENELFKLGNEYRQEKGLPPFIENSNLKKAAQNQAQYCAKNNLPSHSQNSRTDATVSLRVDKTGYQWVSIAENVAENNKPDAKKTLKQWIKSPGHNSNLLSKNKEVGYASASGSNGKIYWIGVYASRNEEENDDSEESNADFGKKDLKKGLNTKGKENIQETRKAPLSSSQKNTQKKQTYKPKRSKLPKYKNRKTYRYK